MEDDGTLLCSYHGWRFNSEGKCTTIPQASVTDSSTCYTFAAACAQYAHRMRECCWPIVISATTSEFGMTVQVNEEKIEQTACASSRSCVKSYPVQVRSLCALYGRTACLFGSGEC